MLKLYKLSNYAIIRRHHLSYRVVKVCAIGDSARREISETCRPRVHSNSSLTFHARSALSSLELIVFNRLINVQTETFHAQVKCSQATCCFVVDKQQNPWTIVCTKYIFKTAATVFFFTDLKHERLYEPTGVCNRNLELVAS